MENSLFRYRSVDKFEQELQALTGSYIWFSKFKDLNDPMEAFHEIAVLGPVLSEIQSSIDEMEEISKDYSICSLSKRMDNSMMWSLYADTHSGIAIEYDSAVLTDWLVDENPLIKVHYSSDAPKIFTDSGEIDNLVTLAIKMMATKHSDWSNEQEVRLIRRKDKQFYHHPDAIKGIYLGANFSDDAKLYKITNAAKRISKPIYKCLIDGYNVKSETIFEPEIKEHNVTIEDRKEAKDSGIGLDIESLALAIRMAKNDKYCNKIVDLDVSDKDETGNTIFVIYKSNTIFSDNPAEQNVAQKMYFSCVQGVVKRVWGTRNMV